MGVVEADLAVDARVSLQQLHRHHHRPVGGVVAPEIQRRQQRWQHPPIVVRVRAAQHGAHPRLEHLIVGLRLFRQLSQRLLHRIQGLTHDVVGMVHGCFGQPEQSDSNSAHRFRPLANGTAPTATKLFNFSTDSPLSRETVCSQNCLSKLARADPMTRTHRVPAPGGTRSCAQTSDTHSAARDQLSPAPPYTPPQQRATPPDGQETGPRSRRTSATDRTRDEPHRSCSPPGASHPRPASTTRSNPRSTTPDARPAPVAESAGA